MWGNPNTTWWGLLLCFYMVIMATEVGVCTCIYNFEFRVEKRCFVRFGFWCRRVLWCTTCMLIFITVGLIVTLLYVERLWRVVGGFIYIYCSNLGSGFCGITFDFVRPAYTAR